MQRRRRLTGWIVPLFLMIGVGVLGAMRGARTGGDIVWASSFEAGVKQARESGKPLLISFHTPGCGWCRKLDAETFTDAKVLELSRRYVCVRADSDVDEDVVRRFRVLEYPMTLILSPKGTEIARFPGYVPPALFAKTMAKLLPEATKH